MELNKAVMSDKMQTTAQVVAARLRMSDMIRRPIVLLLFRPDRRIQARPVADDCSHDSGAKVTEKKRTIAQIDKPPVTPPVTASMTLAAAIPPLNDRIYKEKMTLCTNA